MVHVFNTPLIAYVVMVIVLHTHRQLDIIWLLSSMSLTLTNSAWLMSSTPTDIAWLLSSMSLILTNSAWLMSSAPTDIAWLLSLALSDSTWLLSLILRDSTWLVIVLGSDKLATG